MKGFLYPLLILLFTNQTSAQIDERERLSCLDVRPLMRMRDPRKPKSEVVGVSKDEFLKYANFVLFTHLLKCSVCILIK